MTDVLLFAIAVFLYLIWRDLPARRFSETAAGRIVKALEAIAESMEEDKQ